MTFPRPSLERLRDDRGSSLAAVLMVVMVVMVIGVASLQTAQHSNDSTTVDRERLQTIESAEAGVHNAMRRLEQGAGCDVSPSAFTDLKDKDGIVGRFRTRIDPEGGTTCGQTLQRVIRSWGYAPTGGTRAMRQIQVAVKLVPQGGFQYSIFAEGSDGTFYVKNGGVVNGDVYSETLDQTKNNVTAENIITPGSIVTQNNAVYSGTLWAGGNVTLGEGSSVAQSVITSGTFAGSQGNVVLDNGSSVGGDVLAKGTVTQGNGVTVDGSVSQNNPNVPPPPILQKPVFTWNPANYTPAPQTGTAAQITTALNTAQNNLQGTFYASNLTGTVVFPTNVTVTGPLTVVAEGKVDLGRSMSVSGGPHVVTIVSRSSAGDSIDFAQSFTGASGLHILFYALGGVDGRNNVNFTGAIYGNVVDAKNTFTIHKSELLATNPPVGFTFDQSSASSFAAIPTLWREVAPGDPPA